MMKKQMIMVAVALFAACNTPNKETSKKEEATEKKEVNTLPTLTVTVHQVV